MRNPEFARRAQKLGELLRSGTSLAPHESELAILVCGAHWMAHCEWSAHKTIAIEAGLGPRTVADLAAKRDPYLRGEREDILYRVSACLFNERRQPASLYERGVRVALPWRAWSLVHLYFAGKIMHHQMP